MSDRQNRMKILSKTLAVMMAFLLVFSAVTSVALMTDSPVSTVASAYSTFAKDSTVVTTGVDLRLRKGAGTSYDVITMLPKGTKLTVLAKNTGEWVKVKTSSGTTGYVSATYLKLSETYTKYTVTGTGVRYRATPNGTIKGELSKGAVISVVNGYSKSAGGYTWYRFKMNGSYYYVASTYLKKTTATVAATGVKLNKTAVSVNKGSSVTLTATVSPTSATNKKVTWTTSNKAVATVSTAGKVTGVKVGTATITVKTHNGKTATCKVTVKAAAPVAATGVKLNKTTASVYKGSSVTLTATVSPTNTTNKKVTWTTSDKAVATVSTAGKVTGVKAGTATITAKTHNGKTAACKVTVKNPVAATGVKLNKTTASVSKGSSVTLTATVSPTNTTNKKVTWTTSDKAVATVSTAGKVTGVKAGTATITAKTHNGKTAACKVTVKAAVTFTKYTVTGTNVRYRATPNGTIKGELKKGTIINVVNGSSKTAGGYTWYRFKMNGSYYYVARDYLKKTPATIAATGVKLNKTSASLKKGSSFTLTATVSPTAATNKKVTWSSSNKAVATVSSAGKVTGVKAGTAVITAKTSNGKTATCKVTVTAGETLVTYTTTTAVNYRTAPTTSGTKVGTFAKGTSVNVVSGYSKSADGYIWYKVKLGSKYYYTVSKYLQRGSGTSSSSTGGRSLPKGKSMYLTTYSYGSWSSSNKSVATVRNGFVYGVKAGTATITWSSGSSSKKWTIKVTAAQPVKFAYCSPNVVLKGNKATFVAITDTTRNSVKFVVNGKSAIVKSYTTEKSAARNGVPATNVRIWKYTTTFSTKGNYTAKVYSSTKADGSGMSSAYKTASAFVVSTTKNTTSSVENRRMSNAGLKLIAHWEGYVPAIELDPLTSTAVPTVGYGFTVSEGETFYNNLTKSEAWALLCEALNGSYTEHVNKFIVNNKVRTNQQQFDSMVSFSYNCGSGWWNGTAEFDARKLMLNAVNPVSVQNKIKAGAAVKGKTVLKTQVYSSKKQTGSGKTSLAAGTVVKITSASWNSTTKAAWYAIKATVNGNTVVGYVPAPYVHITSHTFTKDLNYMDAVTYGSEFLKWHHAGGNCYAGLVYRRLAECKLFSFGDYTSCTTSARTKNTYHYLIPACISGRGWLS